MTCSPSTVYGSVENVTFSGWEVLSISVSESNRIFVAFSESVLLNILLTTIPDHRVADYVYTTAYRYTQPEIQHL